MNLLWAAILAVALAERLGEPRIVRFRTAAGESVSGEMTAWDAEGIDGSFGRRAWRELAAPDAWRLYVMVMDRGDAAQWLDLGRALLEAEQGEAWAERAFRRAIEIDRAMEARVADARDDVRRRREEAKRAVDAAKLRTQTPEAEDWPAVPWPAHDALHQVKALPAVRAEAEALLDRAGLALEPVETAHFLVYAELPQLESAQLAARLESLHDRMAWTLHVDANVPHYWGKAVVICIADPDRFRLFEAETFGQLAGRDVAAICHPAGERVYIVLRGAPTGPEALRAAAHAYLHRHLTPRRLPPWANEGLASYVAAQLAPGPWAEEERRRAIAFVRGGGDVPGVLDATYAQGWPGPGAVGPALGTLLLELLIAERPEAFPRWVSAVKGGRNWVEALGEVYGPPGRLVDTFVQYYRVND